VLKVKTLIDIQDGAALGAADRRRIITGMGGIIHERIDCNPAIMLGKPVIKGTRITVELIVRKIAEGADEKYLLDAYPRLCREDIQAALHYAADVLADHKTSG
jgi:uncharacterized protein (DUF433 family)